jgi:hypothetical protein
MTQVNYPQVRKIKGLAKEKEIKMLPFYVEGDSELASEIAFRILLHIRNKFGYTPYQLPVEIYIFWQNPSIIDFRKEAMDDYFDTDSPINHLQPDTICDLFCHRHQLQCF